MVTARPWNVFDVLNAIELDRQKRAAISVVLKVIDIRARTLPSWWQWTVYLAAAITIRRIETADR